MITIKSICKLKEPDRCIFDMEKAHRREVYKSFHPDNNSGYALAAFNRISNIFNNYTSSQFIPCEDVNEQQQVSLNNNPIYLCDSPNMLTVNALLHEEIHVLCETEDLCDRCHGIGYVSNNHVVEVCGNCNNGITTQVFENQLAILNGNVTPDVEIKAEGGNIVFSTAQCTYTASLKDGVAVSDRQHIAIICTLPVSSATITLLDTQYILDHQLLKLQTSSNIFELYTLF